MGKSFTSFYFPAAPRMQRFDFAFQDVLEREMAKAHDHLIESFAIDAEQRKLTAIYGPGTYHRPDRRDYDEIRYRERVRQRNRENIAALGRPAGSFRRP